MRTVRIFVSSPSDALAERRRVSRVIERLNAGLADSLRLEAVRWEERFYSAHDGFQQQIPRSGECEIVLAILRGRLGSPLSAAFHAALPPEERPSDGRPYPSGTAYEILSAIKARQRGAPLPDIFVFRWPNPPQVSLDAPDFDEIDAQWAALKRFAEEVFLTPEGQFKGAYQTYASLDDFEAQAEALLRVWLRQHVLGEHSVLWSTECGSPFRGLEPFGMRHAPVFFGRAREVARAVKRLKASAAQGLPVQLVLGPSGAGKSSFLRAGLVARLIAPGEVEGVGAWRVALMRPGGSPQGPVAALARCLFEPAAAIDPAEVGRPEALPELGVGAFATPGALSQLLAHADETSVAPIRAVLDRVGEAGRTTWGSERPEPARLLLVVDQLDEIFAATITDAQRTTFARLLEALARSGLVWVVASLRAEFYEALLKSPLAGLAGDEHTLTLKPPGLAEMAEIVREPARAAGLEWECDPSTGERLDERLLAEIDRPDLLPLLQFVLDRLYERREGGGGDPLRLTFAAYKALGTIDGAIRAEAERLFSSLGPAEQGALPRLLRGLVIPAHTAGLEGVEAATYTLSSAALTSVAPSEAGRRLAAALVDARLLVSGRGPDGATTVGLAHQRVIEAWDRAKTIVADSARFHRVRAGLAARRRDWEEGKRAAGLLLPRGVILAQAEEMTEAYGDEVAAEDLSYLKASRRHAGRALRRAYALAALFAVVALGGAGASWIAYRQSLSATRNFNVARNTIDQVIQYVASNLSNIEGIRSSTIEKITARVESAMQDLTEALPNEPSIQKSRAIALIQFGRAHQSTGNSLAALSAFEQSIAISRDLIKDNADNDSKFNLFVALIEEGDVKLRLGETKYSIKLYNDSADVIRSLYIKDKYNDKYARALWNNLVGLCEAKIKIGEISSGFNDCDEGISIIRNMNINAFDKNDSDKNLVILLRNVAQIKLGVGDTAGANALYSEALAINQNLAQLNPNNVELQIELAITLGNIADLNFRDNNISSAINIENNALSIIRKFAPSDPDNTSLQFVFSSFLSNLGKFEFKAGQFGSALALYQEKVSLMRSMVRRNPENIDRKREFYIALQNLSQTQIRVNDVNSALNNATEAIAVVRELLQRNSENISIQKDLCVLLYNLGDTLLRAGNSAAARASYDESKQIIQILLQKNPENLDLQSEKSKIEKKVVAVKK